MRIYYTGKNYEFRDIDEKDIERNKDIIIKLLENNLLINFPRITCAFETACENYEIMLKSKHDDSSILIGYFMSNIISGFIWAYKRNVFNEQQFHISHFIVDEIYRGKGVGTMLIYALKQKASEFGVCAIELMTSADNLRALKFYEYVGFETTRVQLELKIGE
jgi:ribosomal protein S18 acetylase RimI-like enzyme